MAKQPSASPQSQRGGPSSGGRDRGDSIASIASGYAWVPPGLNRTKVIID